MRHCYKSSIQRCCRGAHGLGCREVALLVACVLLLCLAVWGPKFSDSVHQHAFADGRAWLGIPCAWNVLSNLAFAGAGLWGLVYARRPLGDWADASVRPLALLLSMGLFFTALGSSLYHWHPDNAGLLWDRLGMAVLFAAIVGLAVHQRVSPRAGWCAAAVVVPFGMLAVFWWAHSGNVLPWAVLQFGGMWVLLALALTPQRAGVMGLRLSAVLLWYGAAKLCEQFDLEIFQTTGQWLSGHSLKHVFSALALWPVLRWLGVQAATSGNSTAGHNGAPLVQ